MLIEHLTRQLREREAAGLIRQRRVLHTPCGPKASVSTGEAAPRSLLAFCSNDYLGMASHPAVVEALAEGARRHGAGSGASHLVSGHGLAHEQLEQALADWVGSAFPECRVLGFSSGFQANLALLTALGDESATLFTDKLNHASLIDGALLARAQVQRYPHARIDRLEALLSASASPLKLIVTDAVFSMDGDLVPLDEILALAERFDAWLVVDDAHGLGVLGPQGQGSAAHFGLHSERLILMGTLGKAVGVSGAFVAAHPTVIEWLMQTARAYIYTTAASPAVAEATRASVQLLRGPEGDTRRETLRAHIRHFREGVQALVRRHAPLGWSLMPSETAIQPLVIGENAAALALSQSLLEQGLWVPAIRPPTVPAGTARLRFTLSAAHEPQDIDRLLSVLESQARGWQAAGAAPSARP